jgi:predicted nucleic acid-binding protein
MKIVVTDACIFIDVININLTAKFFGLELDIHTTADIINELYPEQKQILEGYKASTKLTVHILTGEEQLELMKQQYPKALTPEDLSVIFIAQKLGDATVLSSDKPLRKYAKKLSIEYHGMLWILDQLVAQGLLPKPEAIAKLNAWINSNLIYRDNAEIQDEVDKRIKAWSK